jgi:hypothetical protein
MANVTTTYPYPPVPAYPVPGASPFSTSSVAFFAGFGGLLGAGIYYKLTYAVEYVINRFGDNYFKDDGNRVFVYCSNSYSLLKRVTVGTTAAFLARLVASTACFILFDRHSLLYNVKPWVVTFSLLTPIALATLDYFLDAKSERRRGVHLTERECSQRQIKLDAVKLTKYAQQVYFSFGAAPQKVAGDSDQYANKTPVKTY